MLRRIAGVGGTVALLVGAFCYVATPSLAQTRAFEASAKEPEPPNRALHLGWTGKVRTKLGLEEFFDEDFSLTAWVMPQYPHAYAGPVFANQGPGVFAAGQGEYRWGKGRWKKSGEPVFFIQVGTRRAVYLAPEFASRNWVHIAVVRRNDELFLYIDGRERDPFAVNDLGRSAVIPPKFGLHEADSQPLRPRGTLQLGRAEFAPPANLLEKHALRELEYNQFYGLLDDVAVFGKALSPAVLAAVAQPNGDPPQAAGGLRKTTTEALVTWTFDAYAGHAKARNGLVRGRSRFWSGASQRNDVLDRKAFDDPPSFAETSVPLTLPIPPDEVWGVVQGYDEPGGSHNGFAAFCYDLAPVRNVDLGSIRASAEGTVVRYLVASAATPSPSGTLAASEVEPNFVMTEIALGEVLEYLHLAPGSQNETVGGGTYDEKRGSYALPSSGTAILASNAVVGQVGSAAGHLHFAGLNRERDGVTIPVAFSDYDVSSDGGTTWLHVKSGHPRKGQWVRRTRR